MIDIVLLRIMKYQKEYKQLYGSIPFGTLDTKTKAILDDFGKYFEKFPNHKKIDIKYCLGNFSWGEGGGACAPFSSPPVICQ